MSNMDPRVASLSAGRGQTNRVPEEGTDLPGARRADAPRRSPRASRGAEFGPAGGQAQALLPRVAEVPVTILRVLYYFVLLSVVAARETVAGRVRSR
jgi:hypothetical protein